MVEHHANGLMICMRNDQETDWGLFSALMIFCGWLDSKHLLTKPIMVSVLIAAKWIPYGENTVLLYCICVSLQATNIAFLFLVPSLIPWIMTKNPPTPLQIVHRYSSSAQYEWCCKTQSPQELFVHLCFTTAATDRLRGESLWTEKQGRCVGEVGLPIHHLPSRRNKSCQIGVLSVFLSKAPSCFESSYAQCHFAV